MSYEAPRIKTVEIGDLLAHLGPARAMLYEPGDGRGGKGGKGGARDASVPAGRP